MSTLSKAVQTSPSFLITLEKLAHYATPPVTPSAHSPPDLQKQQVNNHSGHLGGMEGDDAQRRQYEQSGYASTQQYGTQRTSSSNVSDRFGQRQLSAAQSPTHVTSTAIRGQSQGIGNYGYTQGQPFAPQLQGSSLQYQQDYPQDQQRQQQPPQQYPQYGPNMMYNIPQQAQPQTYESVPQFQQRQSAAVEVLPNQFGVPQYFSTGEATSMSGPASMTPQFATTQFQQPMSYQSPAQLERSGLSAQYTPGMAEYGQTDVADVLESQDSGAENNSYNEAYEQYQNALRQTFESTSQGRLVEAGRSLLGLTDWLLGNVVDLGLTRDEQELHSDRIKLWNEFNLCWLAVLQRQKDNTQKMIETGQNVRPPESVLEEEYLERMGREIVRFCDSLERHGLVDYQMGVWEEEIISTLKDCLDLLEGDGNEPPQAGPAGQRSSLSNIR